MNDAPTLRALAEQVSEPPRDPDLVYDYRLELRDGGSRPVQHPLALEMLAAYWQQARANDGVLVFANGLAVEARSIALIEAVICDPQGAEGA